MSYLNPFSGFAVGSKYLSASGGSLVEIPVVSGYTVDLVGGNLTNSVGSLQLSNDKIINPNLITSDTNNLQCSVSISITGLSLSNNNGSVGLNSTLNVSSVYSTSNIGSLTVTIDESASLTLIGTSTTSTIGNVSKSINVSIGGSSSSVSIGNVSNGRNKQITTVNSISSNGIITTSRNNVLNSLSINSNINSINKQLQIIQQSVSSQTNINNFVVNRNVLVNGINLQSGLNSVQIGAVSDITSPVSGVFGILNLGTFVSSSSSVVQMLNNLSSTNLNSLGIITSRNINTNNSNIISGNLEKTVGKGVNGLSISSNVNGVSLYVGRQITQNSLTSIINGLNVTSSFGISSNLIVNNLSNFGKNISKPLQQNITVNGYVYNVEPLNAKIQELTGVSGALSQGYLNQDRTLSIGSNSIINELGIIDANLVFGLSSENLISTINDLEGLFIGVTVRSNIINSRISGFYNSKQFLKILSMMIYFNSVEDNKLNFNNIITKRGTF